MSQIGEEHVVTMRVDPSHVMMFARALGELDASLPEPGDESVPVTFPVAAAQFDPDNELRPTSARPWFGSGREAGTPRPTAVEGTRLHAEQHFEYHRPIRVGDELTSTRSPGARWTKTSSKGGELEFFETLTHVVDSSGEPVLTMRSVSVIVKEKGELR
ncbi:MULTISPECIES: MaoC family dehydratase N-terminal domain-containing protein [unclassified Rhodococcus (in: high G+C Gram-positive bacteria)]|uniref:FAS1-like dehydratase domain-containing protein n=1 Tax=unclassified Rhodococcus (in: high G+C Gram-positive bacteria) TaxID=192944 RepID=UPI0006FC84D0|nr:MULTISPECIES: MaoC family dehydratase N-terminal domain-containing protein [unclassified Rhodococcus (in: high G+C Gram-positive bacteria)]